VTFIAGHVGAAREVEVSPIQVDPTAPPAHHPKFDGLGRSEASMALAALLRRKTTARIADQSLAAVFREPLPVPRLTINGQSTNNA
jgi:hypothetical protein